MSAPGLRERKAQRTRAAIVSAAMRLFRERGFEAAAVEDIAAAAEVAPRTLYRYFPTKEDLLFSDTTAEVALHHAFENRERGESDLELAARAMCEAMVADQERIARTRELMGSTPALRGRALLTMWHTSEAVAQCLLEVSSKGRDPRFRAQIIATCATTVVRTAFFDWLDKGSRGSAWKHCRTALEVLRTNLDP